MNTAILTFETLYFLESEQFYLIEIKRNDLPDTAPASERFKWVRLEKVTDRITQLTFASMDSSEEIEERYFEEGFLKFNPHTGTFIEKYNSAQYPLENKSPNAIPSELKRLIQQYFKTKSHQMVI